MKAAGFLIPRGRLLRGAMVVKKGVKMGWGGVGVGEDERCEGQDLDERAGEMESSELIFSTSESILLTQLAQ